MHALAAYADFPDRAAYRGRMSPYASPQLYQGGPHIVAPDSGNFRYSSSPGYVGVGRYELEALCA